jgi:hypothetical protein
MAFGMANAGDIVKSSGACKDQASSPITAHPKNKIPKDQLI